MRTSTNFLGLPSFALNALSLGLFFLLVSLGIRVAKSSDILLQVANAQLVTSSSANRLAEVAAQLNEEAELIKQKELARQQLAEVYQQSLKGKEGYEKLQSAIEVVEALPPVENLEDIQTEISVTGEILSEITTEQ